MKISSGTIVSMGMGGFLNPPTHPEHTQSVKGTGFWMSLSRAAECEWLDEWTRRAAKGILASWHRPPLESKDVQNWIHQVLGYFEGCYSGNDKDGNVSWNVSDLRIDHKVNPMLNVDMHAGIRIVRKYYPEFNPSFTHFTNAYWGKRT